MSEAAEIAPVITLRLEAEEVEVGDFIVSHIDFRNCGFVIGEGAACGFAPYWIVRCDDEEARIFKNDIGRAVGSRSFRAASAKRMESGDE